MSSSSKEAQSDLIRAKDVRGLDLWTLPSFDPYVAPPEPEPQAPPEPDPDAMEEVPLDEVQPLTLEELESIRQEAWNEGFATGEREGFHSTRIKVRQEAEVALTARLESLEQVMRQLLDPLAGQDAQIEKAMVHLVEHIARQVIQRELQTDSQQITHVLRDCLKLLPMGANNLRIFVNPQDFDLIKVLRERHEEDWKIFEDDALLPGGCRIETEHSRIDASIETRIKQAIARMYDQMHEQVAHPAAPDLSLELPDVTPARASAAVEEPDNAS
ncbi:flagellar assembly protein FliH [Pseudomonas syringae]|nr:flagellar assembly protein FliH [Pseudomonas syringae]MBD8574376.1 flagellar assembly protein FliH [Pseudomonas syringae]MBD8788937.1 flagellar assembly protein FliH [Pseudomonas syringae]MBD8800619.1 flagellar assembly protein FliH [Pseudomonas syringae]MBD8812537.1 flagellar assembly protein FliH [Pseudomonas syringae]